MEIMPTPDQFNLAVLVLRLVVGPVFAYPGFAKIFRGGRLAGTAGWFDSIGMHRAPCTPGWPPRRAGHGNLHHARPAHRIRWHGRGGAHGGGVLDRPQGQGPARPHRGLGVRAGPRGHRRRARHHGPGEWSLDNALGIDLNGPAGFAIALGGGWSWPPSCWRRPTARRRPRPGWPSPVDPRAGRRGAADRQEVDEGSTCRYEAR